MIQVVPVRAARVAPDVAQGRPAAAAVRQVVGVPIDFGASRRVPSLAPSLRALGDEHHCAHLAPLCAALPTKAASAAGGRGAERQTAARPKTPLMALLADHVRSLPGAASASRLGATLVEASRGAALLRRTSQAQARPFIICVIVRHLLIYVYFYR